MTTKETPIPDISELQGYSLGHPAFWSLPPSQQEAAFAALRRQAPVSFQPEYFEEDGPGFWAVTRMAEVREVSKNPAIYSSASGVLIVDTYAGNPKMETRPRSLIAMDDPEHARIRSTVARVFTPKVISTMEEKVTRVVNDVIDRFEHRDEIDIVEDLAAPVPLRIICEVLGIEPEYQDEIIRLTNMIIAGDDPEFGSGLADRVAGQVAMRDMGEALAERKAKNPGDDLTSMLLDATADGGALRGDELGPFFMLLAAAGNETTRNSISHGMKALTDFPDQRAAWMADFEGLASTAVDEILRWSTPANSMRRTAMCDTELAGAHIRKGDKVVMFYNSANRDADVFNEPFGFDISRTPNEQASFGAGGAHFCLGAHLARMEIKILFREVFRRVPNLRTIGEPEMAESSIINAMKRCRALVHA